MVSNAARQSGQGGRSARRIVFVCRAVSEDRHALEVHARLSWTAAGQSSVVLREVKPNATEAPHLPKTGTPPHV
jgi:hypothetical protein